MTNKIFDIQGFTENIYNFNNEMEKTAYRSDGAILWEFLGSPNLHRKCESTLKYKQKTGAGPVSCLIMPTITKVPLLSHRTAYRSLLMPLPSFASSTPPSPFATPKISDTPRKGLPKPRSVTSLVNHNILFLLFLGEEVVCSDRF